MRSPFASPVYRGHTSTTLSLPVALGNTGAGVVPPDATPIALPPPQAFHLAGWERKSDKAKVKTLRSIAESAGRDPRIRNLAMTIIRDVRDRDYPTQAAVLLSWVQANVRYVNEPGEVLQDPMYTLRVKYGDCDDMALLLGAFYTAVGLPWRFVLSGTQRGQKIRWIEGDRFPSGAQFAHIYVTVGWPAFGPTTWAAAEPTIKGSPLGWEPAMTGRLLPEMGGGSLKGFSGASGEVHAPPSPTLDWKYIASAVVAGAISSVIGLAIEAAWRRKH